MSDLLNSVERSIRQRHLFKGGQSILVGVSGGMDSVVLLHLLHTLTAKFGWRLCVAHFNHQLRGSASDADEEFVSDVSRKLALRFVSERSDVVAHARSHKLSIEMAARELRHAFLARAARRLRIPAVALAHHADDQVELFFLRLLRGAGGDGLAAMKWRSSSPADPKVQLVRPLLDQTKAVLREFSAQREIPFREDSTNAALELPRNRVRHKLLPLLTRDYQPALVTTTLRSIEILGAETDFVKATARQWVQGARRRLFDRLHTAVQRQVILLQLLDLRIAAEFELVERLRVSANQRVSVGPRLTLWRDESGCVRQESVATICSDSGELVAEVKGPEGIMAFGGLGVSWQIQRSNRRTSRLLRFAAGREFFDADKVGSPVVLRHWRAGDRFRPIGMSASVKLQDLFTDRKIPRSARHALVVAESGQGELFWVESLRISETFKLTGRTRRRLLWEWARESEVAGGRGA